MPHMYDTGLDKNPANFVALSPISFLKRVARVHPKSISVVYEEVRHTWAETYERCCRLASSLAQLGIKKGDTVSVLLPNTPAMYELHFAVPMLGAVLNTLNYRLDAESIAFMLEHSEAKLLIVDVEFSVLARKALALMPAQKPRVIDVNDRYYGIDDPVGDPEGDLEYETLVANGDPHFAWSMPEDEWQAITLNYTSGTTGNPKGVVTHHRGAYLNAVGNALAGNLPAHPVYLWTLPMFHCNGWCFPWAMAMMAGVNVCLRRVEPAKVFKLIKEEGITHMCGAPIVYNMLVNSPLAPTTPPLKMITGMVAGASPPVAVIVSAEKIGIRLLHTYGLTEVYGPSAVCAAQPEWEYLSLEERARLNRRQGVPYHLQEDCTVLDPETMAPVPWDGETIGEIFFKGNIVMKGYLKNEKATTEAFEGGWFHTGDLGVVDPKGYVMIKDRSKDIIISGGENISSVEVEDVLYGHPAVLVAAVVAAPDLKWGEVPCAFIEVKPDVYVTPEELIAFCREHLAHFKVPKHIIFSEIPKTSTGKVQKFALRQQIGSATAIAET